MRHTLLIRRHDDLILVMSYSSIGHQYYGTANVKQQSKLVHFPVNSSRSNLSLRRSRHYVTNYVCLLSLSLTKTSEISPAHIFCDNETVTKNSTLVESTLNKKHSSIAYHYVRWNVAAGIASIAWIPSGANLSDPFRPRSSMRLPGTSYLGIGPIE
jgi:hypothetical protein